MNGRRPFRVACHPEPARAKGGGGDRDRTPRRRWADLQNLRRFRAKALWRRHRKIGGGDRDRTDDLKLAKLPLSQLSYAPFCRPARPAGGQRKNDPGDRF